MPTEVINPNWIQAGELGLAFVVIILCAWLVLYTMKTSASREALLLSLIENQQVKLSELSGTIEKITSEIKAMSSEITGRLDDIEEKVNTQPSKRTRKAAK
jgi:peptidoglycan hydrolase CwlO-like protein